MWEQPDYAVYRQGTAAPAADPAPAAHRRLLRTDLYMPTDYMLRQLLAPTPVRWQRVWGQSRIRHTLVCRI